MHKAAVNIGRRPTVDAAGADITVEAHLLHAFAGDFYGRRLRVVLCGCAHCLASDRHSSGQQIVEDC